MTARLLRSVFLMLLAGHVVVCQGQQPGDDALQADNRSDDLWNRFKQSSSISVQSLLYSTDTNVKSDSFFNPGNRLLQLPAAEFNAEVRTDFQFQASKLTITLKPRF